MSSSLKLLQRLVRILDGLCEYTGRAVAWLTLAMVLVTFAVVVLRKGFETGWIAMQESVTWMHAMVFLVGAAYTLKHDGHVRVDILYQRWGPRGRAWIDLLGSIFLLAPTCLYILLMSWDYVATSWSLSEGSRETGGIPAVYLLKSFILIMGVMLLLQGLASALHNLQILLGKEPAHRYREPEV
jgi:TRAP-type mannitol/chloroaromatic compound transport system permease small subunit